MDIDRLRELLDYDPETGVFTWKVSKGSVKKGDVAGRGKTWQYVRIVIDGQAYLAHRLVFAHMHGVWIDECVDHIDGDKHNNSRDNLRPATYTQNKFNTPVRSDNTSGYKGVSFCKREKKWRSYVSSNGRQRWLGYFDTAEEADAAARAAREKLHGEFARHE